MLFLVYILKISTRTYEIHFLKEDAYFSCEITACSGEMLAHLFFFLKQIYGEKNYVRQKEKCLDFEKSREEPTWFTQEGCGIYLLEIFSCRQETHMFRFTVKSLETHRLGLSRNSQSFPVISQEQISSPGDIH